MMQQRMWRRRFALVSIAGLTVVIWLLLLPWVARQPRMQQHLSELERQGIDGGAMYYTELEVMEKILHRLER